MMQSATRRLLTWLGPLLVLAAILRLVGIGHGLPFAIMGDTGVVDTLLPGQDGDNGAPLLPWLYMLLSMPVLAVAWLWNGLPGGAGFDWVVLDNTGAMLLAARLGAVALSLATVALVALTARRLFNDSLAGVIAGLLMATSWLSSALAHSADRWTAMAFFLWLTVYIALRYGNRPGPRRALLVGLAAGLGLGTGVLGGMGLLAGLAVHLARHRRGAINRNLAWMLAPVMLLGGLFGVIGWDGSGGTDAGVGARLLLVTAWWAEPVLLIGGPIGMALILRRHAGLVGLMLAAGVLWTLAAAWSGSLQQAALLPLLPVLALAAGGGGLWLAENLPQRLSLPVGIAGGLILLYPLATAGWFSLLLAFDDTRLQAAGWLTDNLAPGSAVVVDLGPVTLPATLDGLLDQELFLPGTLDPRMALALDGGWPGEEQPELRAVHVGRATEDAIAGDGGRALFLALRQAGYDTFAVGLRDDGYVPTGLQRAVLDDYEMLALFLTAEDDAAPPAPDLAAAALVDSPVWRLFLLDRLGPTVLIARVGAP